jgi:hypothetical protein
MERVAILQAQTIRAVQVRGIFGYLPEAVQALVKQYQFVGYPRESELSGLIVPPSGDPNLAAKPATFTQGRARIANKDVVIDSLQIYQNGLIVSTRTGTDDSDAIVADVLRWSGDYFKVTYDELKPSAGHGSQLEFKFVRSLPELMPTLRTVGRKIADSIEKDFWGFEPPYQAIGVNFYFDRNKFPAIAPGVVKIDYRASQPFEKNIYWSEAPLSTTNHEAVLVEFEQACLNALK